MLPSWLTEVTYLHGAVLLLGQVELHDFGEILVEVMLVPEASVELPDLLGCQASLCCGCLVHD